MKAILRRLLKRLGLEIRHCSDDPVVRHLDTVRETLRLGSSRRLPDLHALNQVALDLHLRELLAIHQPDLLVDVGANRGQFADRMRALGYTGALLSLEPQQRHAQALRDRAGAEGRNWTVLHAAAGEQSGRLTLQTFADDVFSSLHTPTAAAHARFGGFLRSTGTEMVDVVRLDDVLARPPFAAARRILLKTDTQGHDLAVLRGAVQTLARTRVVLAEAALVRLYATSASPEELAALLLPLGLRAGGAYAIAHDERDLVALELDCLFVRPADPSE